MRGKANTFCNAIAFAGITPAYAGKSVPYSAGTSDEKGSPPPMRGKAGVTPNKAKWDRITPAYAGKSCFFRRVGVLKEDHPRLCGEKPKMRVLQMHVTGSPPPMRGKDALGIPESICFRITPAYAGKRIPSVLSDFKHRDHPRLCGEKCWVSYPAKAK